MNKLKTGKGALKDYNRYLADEYDDYAKEPEDHDPIAHITSSNTYHSQSIPKKPQTRKLTIKQTTRWPKYQPDFNFVAASAGIFEGLVGEKMAQYLTISDAARLLRTCEYLNRIFSKASIWTYYLSKSYHTMQIPKSALATMNVMQYSKYLRGARNHDVFFKPDGELGMRNDGIVFDTVVMEKHVKNEEDIQLVKNVVDFQTVKSQKTSSTVSKLALQGTITGDVKISLIKEMNQVCVWVAGYHARFKKLQTIAGILLIKTYDKETQLINKAYFLNDRYFAIEIEEKNEDGECAKTFEIFVIEPEPNWLEKKEAALCRQVLKQTFTENKIKLKMIGDFLVFLVEREKNRLAIQIFDFNGNNKCVYKSEELSLDAGFSDVIPSKLMIHQTSFKLHLLDKESNVYLMNFDVESGVTLKKMNQLQTDKEEVQLFNDKDSTKQEEQRFLDPIRQYYHGTYKAVNGKPFEYMMVYKEKKFYLLNFDDTNELVHCSLPEYDVNLRFYNWTIYENYLYILLDTTIHIYQLDLLSCSAVLYKRKTIRKAQFNGDHARWILVNPCMTVVVSASSLTEGLVRSLQLFIGSTQRLLMKVDHVLAFKCEGFDIERVKRLERQWPCDECRLDNIVGHVDKWQINEKEAVEFKFEDERFLIQTDTRSYFRDFNVYERRLNQEKYGWGLEAIHNLNESTCTVVESFEDSQEEDMMKKKNDTRFVKRLEAFENKNHEKSQNKKQNHNWKDIEKKPDTEAKIEKKESRKKGEKYFKNVRQGKHREKMCD